MQKERRDAFAGMAFRDDEVSLHPLRMAHDRFVRRIVPRRCRTHLDSPVSCAISDRIELCEALIQTRLLERFQLGVLQPEARIHVRRDGVEQLQARTELTCELNRLVDRRKRAGSRVLDGNENPVDGAHGAIVAATRNGGDSLMHVAPRAFYGVRRVAAPSTGPRMLPQYRGLTQREAEERLRREGSNDLPSPERHSLLELLGEVMREPMFVLLPGSARLYAPECLTRRLRISRK